MEPLFHHRWNSLISVSLGFGIQRLDCGLDASALIIAAVRCSTRRLRSAMTGLSQRAHEYVNQGKPTMEIVLTSSRSITLRELRLRGTYEGLLEGLPTKEKNRRLLELLSQSEVHATYAVVPFIVPPQETKIELPQGVEYPFGSPSALPPVVCTARFESLSPTLNGTGDASGIVVVWFQEHFAVPPPAHVLQRLREMDWDNIAGNFEY